MVYGNPTYFPPVRAASAERNDEPVVSPIAIAWTTSLAPRGRTATHLSVPRREARELTDLQGCGGPSGVLCWQRGHPVPSVRVLDKRGRRRAHAPGGSSTASVVAGV